MELLTYLKKSAGEGWLIGVNLREFNSLVIERWQELIALKKQRTSLNLLLCESNPTYFLAGFLAAVAAECRLFLCNPNWKEQEWRQVFELVQPDLIWGQVPLPIPHPLHPTPHTPHPNLIMLPTGGSSGKIRFAVHTWETLSASVAGFHRYFGNIPIHSFCVLPLYHVSGLMQFLRSFLTGGTLQIYPYQALKAGDRPEMAPTTFISLVPTQLQALLEFDPHWLARFDTVLLGGAPAWQSLLETARNFHIPLALTYGMTETASQVVTLKPKDFLQGNNSSGQVLPHAQVDICRDRENLVGRILIKADSLCLGYYPNIDLADIFSTDDLGYFDTQGYLHIVGRRSQKIITGGENVFPAEVEAAILATELVKDVCVIGLSDHTWGQAVTAVYVPKDNVTLENLRQAITEKLSKFKQPKHWIQVETLSRNAQGKVNFQQLQQLAVARVLSSSNKRVVT